MVHERGKRRGVGWSLIGKRRWNATVQTKPNNTRLGLVDDEDSWSDPLQPSGIVDLNGQSAPSFLLA